MPFTGAETPTPAAASQVAAQAAVTESVVNPTLAASTAMGTTAGIAQTTPGAIGLTTVTTGASTGIGAVSDLPELSPIAWLTTFAFQGIKHLRFVNQDRDRWFILPILALVIGLGLCYMTSHGDWWIAGAKAARASGLAAYNAALNYATCRPLGIFSAAANAGT